jgi:acyl-CoA hydrolase
MPEEEVEGSMNSRNMKTQWKKEYATQIKTAAEAIKQIQPGQRIFIGTGCGQPQALVQALAKRSRELVDTEIIDFLTPAHAPHADSELASRFRINSFFIADGVRQAIQSGLGDYTPIFLSDIPDLFASGRLPLDVALIQVTPPDEKGRCSLGVAVDIVRSALENASLVVAQVNSHMPRTLGDSMVHLHNIDILVPHDEPILELPLMEPTEEVKTIGEYVAALVEDGSTMEFGIGMIPQAVAGFLKKRKNLGIHTEMFTDSIIDLIESGVVDGSRKSMDKGKVVASFCMGTRKLYDYIDSNPAFAFYPTEHVNDPFVISRQNKQVAINVALEVDLTGQVCADSIGSSFYSGIGGQVDFNRGAAKSPGGKAIIALSSTAKKGTVSRITSRLTPGAGVVTTRGDVHYVITEYGTAYLHGKTIQERAVALISIAHPDFRENLLEEAIEAGYLSSEFAKIERGFISGAKEFHKARPLEDGTLVTYRTMRPTDEPSLKELFYALSQETIYYRFMSRIRNLPRRQIKDFVYINHRTSVAIVAIVPEAHGDEIIGLGQYYLDETTNMAEVAFTVRDSWQSRGIGTTLLSHLITVARNNGISGFTAEVLPTNKKMQRVLSKSECRLTSIPDEQSIGYRMEFK